MHFLAEAVPSLEPAERKTVGSESQNEKSFGPTPLLTQGPLEPITSIASKWLLKRWFPSHGRRLHNHSGKTVPMLSNHHSKEVLPHI